MKSFKGILGLLSHKIRSAKFLSLSRKKPTCFIRNRKMPFANMIYFMLNSVKKTLQIELTDFMQSFSMHKNITKSAYSQQRMNLKHEAFIELNDFLIEKIYSETSIKRWNGFRLMGVDGSTLELPKSEEILRDFGDDNGVPMTRISTMYDLLNEFILDSVISKYISSELYLAINHFSKLMPGDLVIMDRGYGAKWLFYMFFKNNIDFIVRIQRKFGKECDEFHSSKECSKIIEIDELPKKSKKVFNEITPFKFRLVKVILENGEVEVLATSLLDEEKYPPRIFKDLYFKRWGTETNFNHLKNHIELGNFTGMSTLAIKQDFYANMLITNIQSMIIQDAQQKLDNKGKKYEYKLNKNLSLGYMKDRVITILKTGNPTFYEELINLFLIEPVPIRPDRKNPRNTKKHKRRYFLNQKRSL